MNELCHLEGGGEEVEATFDRRSHYDNGDRGGGVLSRRSTRPFRRFINSPQPLIVIVGCRWRCLLGDYLAIGKLGSQEEAPIVHIALFNHDVVWVGSSQIFNGKMFCSTLKYCVY